ncbi:MAG: response regulator transcription factor [Burkholderiaceae bacterium]
MRLLLIEDDLALQTSLRRALERRGLSITLCDNGVDALAQWSALQPDLVLLDLSLPDMDGLDVLAQARKAGLSAPVLVLTARGTVGDRILGLNAGADDYLAKPFDLDELEARVRALLRRAAGQADDAPQGRHCGPLRVDAQSGAIYHGLDVLELSPREIRLMHALMDRPGRAVSREQLFGVVFPGQAEVQHEAIEVVVYRLRKKLAHIGVTLMTLRGLGYLLKAD